MLLWGQQWTRAELMKRVGSTSQLGGIRRYEFSDGRAKGVSALRVRTAAGLDFSILPEKGMDIVEASYKGRSLCWHSPVGIVHPAYYDPADVQWLKTFPGGLIGTCGSTYAGSPCEDAGELLGLHGSIANVAAEHVQWSEDWKKDDLLFNISGKVREVRVFGPNLVMHRTISTSLASRSVQVIDQFVNEGFAEIPLMQIYHLNFGFPLVTEQSQIYAPSANVAPRTEIAGSRIHNWASFDEPRAGISELVYYHDMRAESDGTVPVVLVENKETRNFGILLTYQQSSLPKFIQWKMPGINHYALGLEPANCTAEGRSAARQNGTLRILQPQETETFAFDIGVLDGEQEVAHAIERVQKCS
jgi:hypothetical protein